MAVDCLLSGVNDVESADAGYTAAKDLSEVLRLLLLSGLVATLP